ncbi:MAG: hypothetical protein RLZZ494_989, partial [Pseudomonadota bacterium]
RSFEVVERPASGPTVAAGKIVSEMFDDAVAGLARAVVARQVWRRVQDHDAMRSKDVARLARDEGRSVVGLDDQRRSVGEEEAEQNIDGRLRIVSDDRVSGERAAGGQITDGENLASVAIDGRRWTGVVHGPHRTGHVPSERAVPTAARDFAFLGAGAVQQAGQVTAREVREVFLECVQAQFGAVQRQEAQHVLSLG